MMNHMTADGQPQSTEIPVAVYGLEMLRAVFGQ